MGEVTDAEEAIQKVKEYAKKHICGMLNCWQEASRVKLEEDTNRWEVKFTVKRRFKTLNYEAEVDAETGEIKRIEKKKYESKFPDK